MAIKNGKKDALVFVQAIMARMDYKYTEENAKKAITAYFRDNKEDSVYVQELHDFNSLG